MTILVPEKKKDIVRKGENACYPITTQCHILAH